MIIIIDLKDLHLSLLSTHYPLLLQLGNIWFKSSVILSAHRILRRFLRVFSFIFPIYAIFSTCRSTFEQGLFAQVVYL